MVGGSASSATAGWRRRMGVRSGGNAFRFSACDARCECQPPNSEDTSDDECDPAHPHWCRPVSNHDWPTHIDPQQVEQRHYGENYPSHNTKCSPVHERSLVLWLSWSHPTCLVGLRQSLARRWICKKT